MVSSGGKWWLVVASGGKWWLGLAGVAVVAGGMVQMVSLHHKCAHTHPFERYTPRLSLYANTLRCRTVSQVEVEPPARGPRTPVSAWKPYRDCVVATRGQCGHHNKPAAALQGLLLLLMYNSTIGLVPVSPQ